ncbi:MAG: hypothetical protein ACOX56_02120 [Acholeplasmataceae bacterium]|jgi:hypothetical protein
MKKNEILSLVTISLSGVLYFVLNLINLIQNQNNVIWTNVGNLLYTILLVVALVYAVIEKRYLAGLVVTSLKITFPYGNKFLSSLFKNGQFLANNVGEVFNIIFAVLLVVSIIAIIFQASDTNFVGTKFELKSFVGPLIVLAFLLVFSNYGNAVISSLAEIVSLLLMAVMTAEFLFLSVFIMIPFEFIQAAVDGVELTFNWYLYLVVGVILLGYGIYALVTHIQHAKHDHVTGTVH